LITVFSAPKPFIGQIGLIQRNALRSWQALGDEVEVLVFGDEPGIRRAADSIGAAHIPQVERSQVGTPLLDSIFGQAERRARHDILCYVNADVLLFPDLLAAVQRVSEHFSRYCLVGQRWDIDIEHELSSSELSEPDATTRLRAQSSLHRPMGSDYFVFPRGLFEQMPAFALGRAGWDNWMLYACRRRGAALVDATRAVTAIHQQHDYGHLPGGRPHYRHPESLANISLAGGVETVFRLRDATWRLTKDGIEPIRPWQRGWRRSLEAALIVRLGAGLPAQFVRLLFHPVEAARYFWSRGGGGSEAVSPTPGDGTSDEQAARSHMVESETPNRSNPHEV
jgi:hypothetical protein